MTANDLPLAGDNSAFRLAVGQKVLNRYTLREILGQGGMGTVWLARDEALDLDIALKFIPSLIVNDLVVLSDLKRETRRNLALTHPHIVRTYDFVQDHALAGISMEYMDSGNLRNHRLDQPSAVFQPADLGEWTNQLVEALYYAHQTASIVHRDLKPANLLLNQRRQLKVADFGIARSLGDSMTQFTGRNTSNGTLLYMSPQQLEGDPAHTLDDVYGVGATLYELCTSRPPFTTGDITRQVLQKVPPSMAERRAELGIPAGWIPQNWEATVAACLAKERADRPQSVREIAVRLGLKEAAGLRVTTKTLPTAKALPITRAMSSTGAKTSTLPPTTSPARTAPVPAQSALDTAKVRGAALLDTVKHRAPVLLDTVKRQAPVWLDAVKRDRRIALAVAACALVLLLGVVFLFLHGSHGGGQPSTTVAKGQSDPHSGIGSQPGIPASTAPGGVLVQTEPAGALAQIDARTAEKTPVMLEDLPPGRHELRVTLAGYDDYKTTLEVKGHQQVSTGKIALTPSAGSLTVTTNPPGLEVAVRGPGAGASEARHTSPWSGEKLPVGEYEISAVRPGWEPTMQKVTLAKAQSIPVSFELTGGSLEINSVPPKATVLANGKSVGITPYVAHDVQPGAVKYTLAFQGYGDSEVSGQVETGQTLTLDAKLMSLSTAAGGPAAPGTPDDKNSAAKAARTAQGDADDADDDKDHHASNGGGSDRTHHTTRKSRPKSDPGSDILNRLKKLPIPFWRH